MTHEESGAQFAAAQHLKTVELQAIVIKAKDDEIARLGIVVADQRATIAAIAAPAAPSEQAEATGNPRDWLMDGSLIYRLNDEGANCDEINVTMIHGSRGALEREAAAAGLLRLICAADCAAAAPAAPLPELTGPSDPNFLLSTMDAKIWADEFCRLNNSADHGMMLSWFACAIMTGFDEANRRLAASPSPAPAPTEPQQWIPTSERMPGPYREVHAKHADGSYRIARWSLKGGGIWQLACFAGDDERAPRSLWSKDTVTHWCILAATEVTSPASRMGGITSKESAETAAPGASIGDDPTFKRMLWMVAQDWTRSDRQIALTCYIDRLVDQRGAR